jgi:N-acetylmuramoyl-L-alanine amidase
MRPIDKLIVHCSASPDHMDIGVKEITRWHVKERGFRTIGYHYVVRRDGTVETGRDIHWAGAHCEGHNQFSIGICWVGETAQTEKQHAALLSLCKKIMDQYKLTVEQVYGHYQFNSHKTCPNFKIEPFRKELSTHG